MGKSLIIKGADFSGGGIVPRHTLVSCLIGGGTGSGFNSPINFGPEYKAELKFTITRDITATTSVIGFMGATPAHFVYADITSSSKLRGWLNINSSFDVATVEKDIINTLEISRSKIVFNGSTKNATTSFTGSSAVNFSLIGKYGTGSDANADPSFSTAMKMYGVKLWDDSDTLLIDAVPCKKSDGTLCLYNKVNAEYIYSCDATGLSYEP